jgi:hypothetical protein
MAGAGAAVRPEEEEGEVVVQASFFRRRGRAVGLSRSPVVERPAATPRPLAVARMLAVAHEIVRLIDDGTFVDQADAARVLGFTRARVTQLIDLTLLAPEIQEEILFSEVAVGRDWISERALRRVAREADWQHQRGQLRTSPRHMRRCANRPAPQSRAPFADQEVRHGATGR